MAEKESINKKNSSGQKKTQPNRLYRTSTNKVIAGVCAGLGDYFSIDPTIIRILFLFLAFFGGSGILLYIILWAVIPSKTHLTKNSAEAISANLDEMKGRAKSEFAKLQTGEDRNKSWVAILLVVFGGLFLLDNLKIFHLDLGKLWPILLIVLGILILRRK